MPASPAAGPEQRRHGVGHVGGGDRHELLVGEFTGLRVFGVVQPEFPFLFRLFDDVTNESTVTGDVEAATFDARRIGFRGAGQVSEQGFQIVECSLLERAVAPGRP